VRITTSSFHIIIDDDETHRSIIDEKQPSAIKRAAASSSTGCSQLASSHQPSSQQQARSAGIRGKASRAQSSSIDLSYRIERATEPQPAVLQTMILSSSNCCRAFLSLQRRTAAAASAASTTRSSAAASFLARRSLVCSSTSSAAASQLRAPTQKASTGLRSISSAAVPVSLSGDRFGCWRGNEEEWLRYRSSSSSSSLLSSFYLFAAAGGAAVAAAACTNNNAAVAAACDDGSSGKKKKKKKKGKESKKKKDMERQLSKGELSPSRVGAEDAGKVFEDALDVNDLPVYTADQVSANNGEDGRPVWMTYGGIVYDVTDFIPNHPGGSEKIIQAAGSAIEPFWYLYRQHFASDLPMRLMEHMAVGRLDEADQAAIDEGLEELEKDDPYEKEPMRHMSLHVHSDTPANMEVPAHLLTNNYLTPASLFYVRHHHPVPFLTPKQLLEFRLKVDLTACGGGPKEFSVDELKKMPKTEVTVTLQCSGNRRSGFNTKMRTSGTPWGQGAISTAKFGGVRLLDVLKAAGMDDPQVVEDKLGVEHVRFQSLDGMMSSLHLQKAANPYGDVIIAYEMNGEPLPRDHGYPLRLVVPGYAAMRSVKWLDKIELSTEESEGPWQRGLNYKPLPPNITDAKGIDLSTIRSMTEVSLFSGITSIENMSTGRAQPGDRVKVVARGWAWSGGGRNIVRVDLTSDDGATWETAKLKEGSDQKFGRAWAWTFWECEIPEAVVREDGSVRLASKAVDLAYNVQPESADPLWNVRGLGNNSWYRAETR